MPIIVDDLIVAFGSLWASTVAPGGSLHPQVVRIDPATNQIVAKFDGIGTYLAAGEGAIWTLTATHSETTLHRIDPVTNEATTWVTVIGNPLGVAAGEGAVWLSVYGTHHGTGIVRVDPVARSVIDRIHVVFGPSMVVGEGHVWASGLPAGASDDLIRGVAARFRVFDVGEGGVWFIGGPHEPRGVCRLNSETVEVDSCVEVASYADTGLNWPAALDRQNDTIWVANYQDTVTRIDLS
jgi:hypothetical protein